MSSEADWRDLYNGMEELLGPRRADTLMSRLSLHPTEELATKSDLAMTKLDLDRQFELVNARFEQIDGRFEQVDARFEQIDARFERVDARFDKVEAGMARLSDRLDHMQLTLIGGLLAIIAAIVLQAIFT